MSDPESFILDTSHGEMVVDADDRESWVPDAKTDRRVATVTIADMERQKDQDNKVSAAYLHACATGDWRQKDALQRAYNELMLRHSAPIESPPTQQTSTKEANEDDSGPRQILRIQKGSGLDGFRQTLIRELQDRLNTTRLNADPNAVAAPAVYKKGYQKAMSDCIALIRNPVFVEGGR